MQTSIAVYRLFEEVDSVSRPVTWVWLVLLFCGSRCSLAGPDAAAFFRPAADGAQQLPPDKLYPQGRLFPFGFFGPNAERDKAAGCTYLGPYQTERNVEQARECGLRCTYTIEIDMDFHGKPLELTPDEIRERIRRQVEKGRDHPEVAWWYLKPEELRFWRANEMTYLEVAARTIHENDPLKRPVWMYEPNHRDAGAMAKIVKHLDLCGKGLYTNYSGQRDSRVWVRWSIEQEVEAVRQANPKAVPIAVPEMFQQPPDELLPMIPRWVRHDVYLSLVCGAKGVVVFSGGKRKGFPAHAAYYEAYAGCGRELNGPLALGQVFLFGQRRNDLKVVQLSGPKSLGLSGRAGEGPKPPRYPPLAWLDAAYGTHRYLFLVNSANEPVRAEVRGLPSKAIKAQDLFAPDTPASDVRDKMPLSLEPLEVKAFRFQAT